MTDKEKLKADLNAKVDASGLTKIELANRLGVIERRVYAMLRNPMQQTVERIYKVLEEVKS
jgi:hypothetical protein